MQPAEEPSDSPTAIREGLPALPPSTAITVLPEPRGIDSERVSVVRFYCLLPGVGHGLHGSATVQPGPPPCHAGAGPEGGRRRSALAGAQKQLQDKASPPSPTAKSSRRSRTPTSQAPPAGPPPSSSSAGRSAASASASWGTALAEVKTLMLTILLYAIFTGLSALSRR